MNAETLDKQFNDGESVIDALDLSKAKRTLLAQKRVNVDFPTKMIDSLDRAFLPFFNSPRRGTCPRRSPKIKHLTCLIFMQAIHGLR